MPNIQVHHNVTRAPDVLEVRENLVANNVQIKDNLGDDDRAAQDNTVGNTLTCVRNRQPFIGTPNTAGEARGQCAP